MDNVGGIWKKTINTKKGPVEILSISIMGKRYTAWPNGYKKEGDKSPDYKIQEDNYKKSEYNAKEDFPPVIKDNSDLPF
jgi:hypothetical protein